MKTTSPFSLFLHYFHHTTRDQAIIALEQLQDAYPTIQTDEPTDKALEYLISWVDKCIDIIDLHEYGSIPYHRKVD